MIKLSHKRNKLTAAISLMLLGATSIGTVSAATLEEVVVTAQKRSQSVQDIPVAVSGLTSDEIEKLGFDDATDLSAQVPNVQVSGTFGKTQPIFSIRGISQSDFNSNQASPVGIYIDEAYMGATFTHGLNFFDLERTEVLRGPQGTLYGRNTTGGAINLITRTPEIDGETTGNISVGIGSFGLVTSNGAIETTLIENKLAARIAYTYERDDGWFENTLGGPDFGQTDFNGARLALNWQVTERLNAVFKYTTGESTPRGIPARFEGRFPDFFNPGQFVDAANVSRDPSLDNFEGEFDEQGNFDSQSDLATLRLTYEADNYSIVSVSSYNDADFNNVADTDGHAAPRNASQVYTGKSESFNQDIRFVSDFDGSFNFIAGIYYGKESNDADVRNTFLNPDSNIFIDFGLNPGFGALLTQFGGQFQQLEATKTASAVYGQARWELSEKLGLDIGLRYTEDEISRDRFSSIRTDFDGNPIGSFVPGNVFGINSPFLPPGALGPMSPGIFLDNPAVLGTSAPSFTEVEREFTGKIGLDYAVSDDLLVYASYNRGFRGGSINNGAQFAAPADLDGIYATPEFLDAYELGLKGDFLDGQLRVNAALFFYDYTDQQFINQVGLAADIENAGGSEIFGAEVEILALLSENLTLQLGIGILDTEFTELSLADTTTADPFDEIDLSGNELISAPELNVSVSLDYDIPLSWGTINAHIDANYQDDQFYSAYNDSPTYEAIGQEAYTLVNASLTAFFGADENMSVSVWGKNLTEKEYDAYAIQLQGLFFDFFMTGAPRTYGLDFNYRF